MVWKHVKEAAGNVASGFNIVKNKVNSSAPVKFAGNYFFIVGVILTVFIYLVSRDLMLSGGVAIAVVLLLLLYQFAPEFVEGVILLAIGPAGVYLIVSMGGFVKIPILAKSVVLFSWLFIIGYMFFLFSKKKYLLMYFQVVVIIFFMISGFLPMPETAKAFASTFKVVKDVPETLRTNYQRSIAMASGDYFAGEVDKNAQKKLGVILDDPKALADKFIPTEDVTVYSTLTAQALDKPLKVKLECFKANDKEKRGKLIPSNELSIATFEDIPVDCEFEKDQLDIGLHDIKLTAVYDFTTSAYLKLIMADKESLREQRRVLNIDDREAANEAILAKLGLQVPVGVYTSGPASIGIGVSSQPLGIDPEIGARIAVSFDTNRQWGGVIEKLDSLYIITPRGLELQDFSGKHEAVLRSSCSAINLAGKGCDDAVENVYEIERSSVQGPRFKNIKVPQIAILHTKVTNPESLLGRTPVSVRNIKIIAHYTYKIEKSTMVNIEKEKVDA